MNHKEALEYQKDWFMLCPQSRNHVACRGKELDDILWQGEQWAVTTYGLERRDGVYGIPLENLFSFVNSEKGKNKTKQDVMVHWFNHLHTKTWCNEDDIDHALQAVLVLFNLDGTRTKIEAPFLMDESDIEFFALESADRHYRLTKDRLFYGVLL